MPYGYVPGPLWQWLPEREKRSDRDIDRKAVENSPRKVLVDMIVAFALSLGVVLLVDVAIILVAFPLKLLHLG